MSNQDNPFLYNNKYSKFTNSALFRVGIGILIGVVMLGGVLYVISSKRNIDELPTTGDEDSELEEMDIEVERIDGADNIQKLARVGREYIFYTDLECYAYLKLQDIDSLEYEEALNYLINESVLLQAGESEGWIELDTETFNNPFKDFSKRGELVLSVRSNFDVSYQSGTYVEIITVWFYNSELGTFAKENGLDVAKEIARIKVDEVYNFVTEEGKSMEEAAQLIINDTSLAQIDENYDGNAYGIRIFPYEIKALEDLEGSSENLYEFLKIAQVGEISEVFLEKDVPSSGDGELVDAYYAFYKLKAKINDFGDIDGWIDAYKQGLRIEIL